MRGGIVEGVGGTKDVPIHSSPEGELFVNPKRVEDLLESILLEIKALRKDFCEVNDRMCLTADEVVNDLE